MAEAFDLLKFAYAHRGLWSPDGLPENSLAAFLAAANAGLGIEMDVRPSLDGVPVCFHDLNLSRMTAHEGFISDYTADALAAFELKGGGTIPLFSDLLAAWPAHLPMLVEMKIDGNTDAAEFAATVAQQVAEFSGLAAMMSFNETAVAAIPNEIMHGQLLPPSAAFEDFGEMLTRALSSDVNYLALHVSDAESGRGKPLPAVCWTVRSIEDRDRVQACGHAEIFEHLPSPLAAS